MRKCPQCDFISPNETYFNQHMTKVHSGQPNCPFCFIAFKNYPTLRNCPQRTKEEKRGAYNSSWGKKKPCRYYNNGQGQCLARSGSCSFDHSVILFSERQLCFQKQDCKLSDTVYFFSIQKVRVKRSLSKIRPKAVKIGHFAEK